MGDEAEAIVIGSGPNGLAAAIALQQAGVPTRIHEADATIGGGTRSAELTLPGFVHDICSAAHPMGILAPFLKTLPLADHGLEWVMPQASVAHPMPDGHAVMLTRSLDETAAGLGRDGDAYRRLMGPLLRNADALLADAMGPVTRIPADPIGLVRFGLRAAPPATWLARTLFRGEDARALFAGCAGHSLLPLSKPLTSALGVLFAATGHMVDWPVARGGSQAIPDAMASLFRSLGGTIVTEDRVDDLRRFDHARAILFDTAPAGLVRIAGDRLPEGYRKRLGRYRYGPGACKVDWALDGPIPWQDERCLGASTVHVGGPLDEIARSESDMYRGRHPERPYLICVQQSQFDASRAPDGKHTGYAYCHVPHGSTRDMHPEIEAQIERFAPGFRDRILARHVKTAADFEAHNPNYVGGAITGGVADAFQLFNRPVTRFDPYATPNPRLFLCSAATPPGGGVHGQCGYWAAQSALGRLRR